jgi:hypothetical protein
MRLQNLWVTLMLPLLITALLSAGCSDRNGKSGFVIKSIDSSVSGTQLRVILEQKISLSQQAKTALENGVPLHFEVRADLQTPAAEVTSIRRFEIRYMPLSNHYRLSSEQPDFVRTYPRLRHALADLSEVELFLPLTGVALGEYQLRARSRLDKRELPAPMRLPAWFSPDWQHDSGWQYFPVALDSLS